MYVGLGGVCMCACVCVCVCVVFHSSGVCVWVIQDECVFIQLGVWVYVAFKYEEGYE